jgi:hypothetical protein
MLKPPLLKQETQNIIVGMPELWVGAIYSGIKKSTKHENTNILMDISKWFEDDYDNFKKMFNIKEDFPDDTSARSKIISGQDNSGNPIIYKGKPMCYLEFKKFTIVLSNKLIGEMQCNFTIRINVCQGELKSKIFTYLQPINEQELNSNNFLIFFKEADSFLQKVISYIGAEYQQTARAEDLKYLIYISNIGTNNEVVNNILKEEDFSIFVNKIKENKIFERAYLDIMGMSYNNHFESYPDMLNKIGRNKNISNNWNLKKRETDNLKTLFSQRIFEENGTRICNYAGMTSSSNLKDVHYMSRSLVLNFINEF